MIKQNKNHAFMMRLAAVIICASLILSGCGVTLVEKIISQNRQSETEEETIATTEASTLTEEEKQKVRAEFDAYCMEVFENDIVASTINLHYTLKNPEAMGITDYPITFGEYTLEQYETDKKDREELETNLATYNPADLDDEQQLTYSMLMDYINTEKMADGYELYDEPLKTTIGVQVNLPILMAEYEFRNKKDIDEYLTLLSSMDEYYTQIIEYEKLKSEAGLFMSDASADAVIASCDDFLLNPNGNYMTETFAERLDTVAGLTDEEKEEYIKKNSKILDEDYSNAYDILRDGLRELKGTGTNDRGLYYYPNGQKYCEYLIRSTTGTSYKTIDELSDAIDTRMTEDFLSMSKIMRKVEVDSDAVFDYSFEHKENPDPKEILDYLNEHIYEHFPELPNYTYNIKHVPESLEDSLSPAFYLVPCIDDYQNNVIYINDGQTDAPSLYPTLAHEGLPGHLYQNVYYCNTNPAPIRALMGCDSFSEGWATYVEDLSYSWDENLTEDEANLLAVDSAAQLGLYAYLDMQINYYGMTREECKDYLGEYYDIKDIKTSNYFYDVMVQNPTNYLKYYVGYMEFMDMREEAVSKLGDRFDEIAFHKLFLDIGDAPFNLIKPRFKSWLLVQ